MHSGIEEYEVEGFKFQLTYHTSGKVSVSTPGRSDMIYGAIHCGSREKAIEVANETAHQVARFKERTKSLGKIVQCKHNYEVHLIVKVKTPEEDPAHTVADLQFALMGHVAIVDDVAVTAVIDNDTGVPFSQY